MRKRYNIQPSRMPLNKPTLAMMFTKSRERYQVVDMVMSTGAKPARIKITALLLGQILMRGFGAFAFQITFTTAIRPVNVAAITSAVISQFTVVDSQLGTDGSPVNH